MTKTYEQAKAEFEAAEQDLKTLQERAGSFRIQAAELKAKLPLLEEKRRSVIAAVALERVSEHKLVEIKDEIRNAKELMAEAEEKEQAVLLEMLKFKQALYEAESRYRAAWHTAWRETEEEELTVALNLDIDPLIRAFCASENVVRRGLGKHVSIQEAFTQYLEKRFVPGVIEQVKEMRETLGMKEREPSSNIITSDDRTRARQFRNTELTFNQAWGLEPKRRVA